MSEGRFIACVPESSARSSSSRLPFHLACAGNLTVKMSPPCKTTPTMPGRTPPQPKVGLRTWAAMRTRQPHSMPPGSMKSRSSVGHCSRWPPGPALNSTKAVSDMLHTLRTTPVQDGKSDASTGCFEEQLNTCPDPSGCNRTLAPGTICDASVFMPSASSPGLQNRRHSATKGSCSATSLVAWAPPWPSRANIQDNDRNCSGRKACCEKLGGCAAGTSRRLSSNLNGRSGKEPTKSAGARMRRLVAEMFQLNSIGALGGNLTLLITSRNSLPKRCVLMATSLPSGGPSNRMSSWSLKSGKAAWLSQECAGSWGSLTAEVPACKVPSQSRGCTSACEVRNERHGGSLLNTFSAQVVPPSKAARPAGGSNCVHASNSPRAQSPDNKCSEEVSPGKVRALSSTSRIGLGDATANKALAASEKVGALPPRPSGAPADIGGGATPT
mmetsp:Transcript_45979/g.133868  ORF Transcript_45979/g.133868 Transcript_45979/m.133868 type:complete len:441 (-) Transcript_45979:19-1341(-)